MGEFSDRLWWARKRKGVGANILSRQVGCAQSLISGLERGDTKRSKYSDAFAKALGVDPVWLSHGTESRAPEGYNDTDARRGRQGKIDASISHTLLIPEPISSGSRAPVENLTSLQKAVMGAFSDFTQVAPPVLVSALMELLVAQVKFAEVARAAKEKNTDHLRLTHRNTEELPGGSIDDGDRG